MTNEQTKKLIARWNETANPKSFEWVEEASDWGSHFMQVEIDGLTWEVLAQCDWDNIDHVSCINEIEDVFGDCTLMRKW